MHFMRKMTFLYANTDFSVFSVRYFYVTEFAFNGKMAW